MMFIEIFTALTAFIAAISSVSNIIVVSKANKKRDLLDNYTSERLYDLHEMKKWANVLLNEAALAIYFTEDRHDTELRISKVVEASNAYRFILKPVYQRDEEVLRAMLDLKNEIIDYYKESKESERKKHIEFLKDKGECFRKLAFLYAHSSWTCIKNQITSGEPSGYNEFKVVYTKNEEAVEKLSCNSENQGNMDIWYL